MWMRRFRMVGLAWLAAAALFSQGADAALSGEDLACLKCHGRKGFSAKSAGSPGANLFVEASRFAGSVHAPLGCTSCHSDISETSHPGKEAPQPVSCAQCHDKADASYNASVHGTARRAGNTAAARCVDCHGSHDIVPLRLQSSPLYRSNLGDTCGKCHTQIMEDVRDSAHGQAMLRGEREAPTCTDCHGDHNIEGLKHAGSMKIAEQICSRCHVSQRMNTKYGMPSNRVSSFFDSYHGLAIRAGSPTAANCASCHGFHNILPAADPRSSVNPANMVMTCQKCHPGASEKFSLGKVHLDPSEVTGTGDKANQWVRRTYLLLIFGTIGAMVAHNGLAFRRKLLKVLRDPRRSETRMRLPHRIQHFFLVTSFSYLAISGFALKYPDSWLTVLTGSSENFRRMGHRVAAIVMITLAFAHLVYVIVTPDGRKFVKDMLPSLQDVRDVFANLHYLVKPGTPKPRFGRFWYAEKAEYWSVVWGTFLMGATGLLIWFKLLATQWMSRWMIEVAVTIHYYEAILACLAIFVWHFYFVIFDPDVYPMNLAWFDGKVEPHGHGEHTRGASDVLAEPEPAEPEAPDPVDESKP